MFVPEAVHASVVAVDEEWIVGVACNDKRMSAGHIPALRPLDIVMLAKVAIVAILGFEVFEMPLRERKLRAISGTRSKCEPNIISACKIVARFHGEKRHLRHAVVFKLLVAQQPGMIGMMRDEQIRKELPMSRDACRSLGTDLRQKFFAILIVRGRPPFPISRNEFDLGSDNVPACPSFPIGRISAAEPEHTS